MKKWITQWNMCLCGQEVKNIKLVGFIHRPGFINAVNLLMFNMASFNSKSSAPHRICPGSGTTVLDCSVALPRQDGPCQAPVTNTCKQHHNCQIKPNTLF